MPFTKVFQLQLVDSVPPVNTIVAVPPDTVAV